MSVVVALDLIALTVDQHHAWRQRAARSAGIAATNIVLSATHTHGGPAVTPGALGDEPDEAYLGVLEERIADAVVEACNRMEAATITQGAGRCTDVARNRRQPSGPIDPVVPVITIHDAGGATKAVVFSYACHPVVLGADNLALTADWPGAARRSIERSLPGATAVFLQGCCGQLNTGHSAAASMTTAPQQRRTFTEAQRIGERVAAEVLAVRVGGQSSGAVDVAVAERPVEFEFRIPGAELAQNVEAWKAELAEADPTRAAILAMWLQWAANPSGLAVEPVRSDGRRSSLGRRRPVVPARRTIRGDGARHSSGDAARPLAHRRILRWGPRIRAVSARGLPRRWVRDRRGSPLLRPTGGARAGRRISHVRGRRRRDHRRCSWPGLIGVDPLSLSTLGSVAQHRRHGAEPEAFPIVHLGPGAFHRAHQAIYSDEILRPATSTGGSSQWRRGRTPPSRHSNVKMGCSRLRCSPRTMASTTCGCAGRSEPGGIVDSSPRRSHRVRSGS